MIILNKKIFLLVFIFLISACALPEYNKKIDNSYYSKRVIANFKAYKNFKATALDFNLYQEVTFQPSDIDIIKNFMLNLKPENYISKPTKLEATPAYRIFISTENQRYILDIYNENYISLFPWDGNYSKDFIDMSKVHLSYNLYSLCKNSFPETK